LKIQFNALLITLNDIIDFSDEILWVTELNKDKNDLYEKLLGVRDSTQKNSTEVLLLEIIDIRNGTDFWNKEDKITAWDLTEEEIEEMINYTNNLYERAKNILSNLEVTLNNSRVSLGQLSETQISAFISQINVYQATLQWNYSAFIAFGSSTKSFLRTYKNNQESLAKAIMLQEKDREIQFKNFMSGELSAAVWYEKTVIGIEDSLSNLESQISLSERNLSNVKENYEITLRSLDNTISEARITYASALKEYQKLSVRSPINGTISEKFIDEWQEVSQWASLFNILSDNTPEVELAFSYNEKQFITEWQKVYIQSGDTKIEGQIYALSEAADANLNYKSTVVFESGTNLIGSIVTVSIEIPTEKMLLPLNVISTEWGDIGYVKTLSWSLFENVRIRLGEVYGEYIEVVSCAENCSDLKIVLNDISNFDENKFVIIEE
jgi:multidrug efflux pump subunit AcrA (membrane-fusion protein)